MPIRRIDVGRREFVALQCQVGHRVQKVVLAPEVPVDARHTDVEMLRQKRHAQVVDGHLRRDFESAVEDVLDVDGASVPPSARLSGHPAASNVTGIAVGERNGWPWMCGLSSVTSWM